jgi:hypothetical protein
MVKVFAEFWEQKVVDVIVFFPSIGILESSVPGSREMPVVKMHTWFPYCQAVVVKLSVAFC